LTKATALIPERTGGEILADALLANGVDTIFGVPGESYIAFLDAIYDRADRLRFVATRQEGGAAFMADAHAKLTGRAGVVAVTRGPGACNASIGIHTAEQDSTPMVVLVGQVPRHFREREAFQEVEFRQMFGGMAKWVVEIDSAERIPEHLSHAFHLAQSGRPGPVIVVLPEDVLADKARAADLPAPRPAASKPADEDMVRVTQALAEAKRPLAILGGPAWSREAKADFERFAGESGLAVVTSLRCQDYFDNDHPCYVGDLGIAANPNVQEQVRQADTLLVIGARLGEMTTQGYTVPEAPRTSQRLIHVYPDASEIGRVYVPDIAVVSDSAAFAAALSRQRLPYNGGRAQTTKDANTTYRQMLEPVPQPGALDLGRLVLALQDRLPRDAIITNGAGNYTAWVHKHYRFRDYRTQLAPTSGAMGYGLPAAVAAKLAFPECRVICFAGDGCFQMNGQELGTILQNGLDPLVIVVNNGAFGTIRMHQERAYPTRVSGTELANPDFEALARAYGFHAEVLERTEDIGEVLDRALAATGPALIEVRLDVEAISPRATLSGIREKAMAGAS